MSKIKPRYIMIERWGADYIKVSELSKEDIENWPKILQQLPDVTNGLFWKRDIYTLEAAQLLKQQLNYLS